MAKKRMVSNQIVDSDAFLDMPLSAQALYLHLLVRADDEGFSNSVKKVMRMIGSRDDDLKVLITKNFVIPFQSGVVVIKHWLIHNTIRKERIQATTHTEERDQLAIKNNNSYTLKNAETSGELESGRHMSDIRQTDDGIDKVSLDKSSLGKSSLDKGSKEKKKEPSKTAFGDFVKLTDTEYENLCKDYGKKIIDNKIEDMNNYIGAKGKQYKSHNHALRSWLKKETKKEEPKKQEFRYSIDVTDPKNQT